jgi:hypothetical protein
MPTRTIKDSKQTKANAVNEIIIYLNGLGGRLRGCGNFYQGSQR